MIRTLFYLALITVSCVVPKAQTNIVKEQFILYKSFPSEHVESRNVEVWLPENYESTQAMRVLYMMDGQNLFHGTKGWSGEYNAGWQVPQVLDSLAKAGAILPTMVVGISNIGAKRAAEYMPAKPRDLIQKRMTTAPESDWYRQWVNEMPNSDAFLKFLVKELKPFIDRNYKTLPQREHTFISGSSMGGLISAYAICEYPDVFGGAACLSTHWIPLEGVFTEYLKTNLPDPAHHKIYFDHGTEGLDAGYEVYQKVVDKYMDKKGYQAGQNWLTKKFVEHDHREADWHSRLHLPLSFLLEK